MKRSIATLLLLASALGAQTIPKKAAGFASQPAPDVHLYNCVQDGGSGNNPNPQDTSLIYRCDGARIEIHGHWTKVVEYGYLYDVSFGVPEPKQPEPATMWDKSFYHWCRRGEREVEMDGWGASQGKINMDRWYPNPKDYHACKPEHIQTPAPPAASPDPMPVAKPEVK